MKICAVILDYRGASKTEACLLSLVSEGIDTVLVVDNSADANASAQLAEVIERINLRGTDFALYVLIPDENLGFARGVNFALNDIHAQRCDTMLLLNNDAAMMPGSVHELYKALTGGTGDLVGPTVIDDHGKLQPLMWYHRFLGLQTSFALPGAFPYLSGCCLLFRQRLLDAGKLFDEDFFMYGEDTFLGWKMNREHRSFTRVETAIVRHTGQSPIQKCSLFYEYHMARAHILLARKTSLHPLELPLIFLAKCFGLSLRTIRRSVKYRSPMPVWGSILAWLPLQIRKTSQ